MSSPVSLEQAAAVLVDHVSEIETLIRDGKLRVIEDSRVLICSEELFAILLARQKSDAG